MYGDPDVHPQPESFRSCVNLIGIRACYDEGKRIAETLLDYQRMHGSEIRIAHLQHLRPAPFGDDDRVMALSSWGLAESNHPHGDGSQSRSFCYVDDLIDGLITLMNGDATGPSIWVIPMSSRFASSPTVAYALIRLPRSKASPLMIPANASPISSPDWLSWQPQVGWSRSRITINGSRSYWAEAARLLETGPTETGRVESAAEPARRRLLPDQTRAASSGGCGSRHFLRPGMKRSAFTGGH